ncbi:MAG: hypothetical protein KJ626_16480 [Verrucomicrobia bacterium]|nr:hypothetical protein [Verrucomicrobiota bacterium]
MRIGAASFDKVHYALRPAKQVERRMFLDTFIRLTKLGFSISNYHYMGMGSVYFVDFAMFHKHLGISKMTSVELEASAKKRLEFNKPFKAVDVRTGDIAKYVACISPDEKYIVWLDYDCVLDSDVTKALKLALTNLSPGSILIVTVDAMPPGGDGPPEWKEHFEDEAMPYLWLNPKTEDFARSKIVEANIRILRSVIASGLVGRPHVDFFPLFNIWYQDGHEMLTIGGMLATDNERPKLNQIREEQLPFITTKLTTRPYQIRVPLVTRKERLSLDSAMPRKDKKWKPEFRMSKKDLDDYERIYRYYPEYAEMYL